MFKYNINNNKTYKSILKKKNIIISAFTLVLYIIFTSGLSFVPVEELGIISGIGADLYNTSSETVEYVIPVSVYNYKTQGSILNFMHTGIALTLGETRSDRQAKDDKMFLAGHERVLVFSEKFATFSIRPLVDILFANPNVNDTALSAVYEGKAEDLLQLPIEGFATSSDYIAGVLKQSTEFNFFSDNYKIMDIYVRMDAEGRNIVLPYIELENNIPKITGLALFNKDIMTTNIGMEDAKYLNLLRENDVRGMLTLQKNSKEYIDFETISKRKVKVEKIDGIYNFTIDLSIIGNVTSNSLYIDMYNDTKVKEKFQKDMENATKKNCMNLIKKMQSEYKLDVLELGRVAAAHYGRGTGTNWNDVICNSDLTNIKVNVEIKIDNMGRGDY